MPGSFLEPYEGLTYLYATLSADATLTALVGSRIYPDAVPEEPLTPYVVITNQGAVDRYAGGRSNGVRHVMTDTLYQVVVFDRAKTYEGLAPIAARIFDVLDSTRGTSPGGAAIMYIRRESVILLQERESADVQWRRAGGIYRLLIGKP